MRDTVATEVWYEKYLALPVVRLHTDPLHFLVLTFLGVVYYSDIRTTLRHVDTHSLLV